MNALVVVLPIPDEMNIDGLDAVYPHLAPSTISRASLIGFVHSDVPDLIDIVKNRFGNYNVNEDLRTILEDHISQFWRQHSSST